ncbi:MAG: hypothetical protein U0U66_08545 [Cytophagaceae bacterium]
MEHKTVFDNDFEILESDKNFKYQDILTKKLDSNKNIFDQNTLNEIILWKVNRYAEFKENLISEINSINPNQAQIDIEKTRTILRMLLNTKGVQLAMASTILRFRNSKIYQIIDQRVYRIINPRKELNLDNKNIDEQIDLYLSYLEDLTKICKDLKINFKEADRILYMADKRVNKGVKLKNY